MDETQELENGIPAPVVHVGTVPPALPHHNVFMGRFGLRAGWGILIWILLFGIISFVLGLATLAATGKLKPMIDERRKAAVTQKDQAVKQKVVEAKKSTGDMRPKPALLGEFFQFVALALATWIMSRIERRRNGVYGIGRYRLHDFLPGVFWGVASLSALVGILRASHLLVFDGRLLAGAPVFIFAAKWLLVFLFVGLLEEYLMRGYMQFTLSRGVFGLAERVSETNPRAVAFWIAAVFMSLVFAAMHLGNAGENRIGIFMVFMAGITFSYALWRTGSLWWAIGFHMAWDWAQSFLWGVPDSGNVSAGRLFQTHAVGNPVLSGGADGPEGSLFVIPVLLLVIGVIRLTSRGEQPSFEPLPKALPQPETHTVVA